MRVRYYCHAGQETGYGRAATELALALVEAGVDLHIVPLNPSLSLPFTGKAAPLDECTWGDDDTEPAEHDVVIIHTMPVDCVKFARGLCDGRPRLVNGGPAMIAYTTWEGVDAPAELVEWLAGTFDQIWVPSTTTCSALVDGTSLDIAQGPGINRFKVLPHTFTPRTRSYTAKSLEPISAERPYQFYWIGAWTVRKNPHGLIRAFCHAFGPEHHVELVLHSPGTSKESVLAAQAATGLAQNDLPRIVLSNKHLGEDALWHLHNDCDCFVTATRGESWNLPAFEALQARRHVIAPSGHGHDDFLFAFDSDWQSKLPDHELDVLITSAECYPAYKQPAFMDVEMISHAGGAVGFKSIGVQGMTSRSTWLDPDLGVLASEMRSAFENQTRQLEVRYDVEARFGHKAVAAKAIEYMQEALDEG